MGIPTFEASDLDQGGKSARVVNCVLALKSYSEWKQTGAAGTWKYSGIFKAQSYGSGKPFMRKNSEPFMKFPRSSSLGSVPDADQRPYDDLGQEPSEASIGHSLSVLVHTLLSNKKQEEIPFIVEAMLSKITEEYQRRLAGQNELLRTTTEGTEVCSTDKPLSGSSSCDVKEPEEQESEEASRSINLEKQCSPKVNCRQLKGKLSNQRMLIEQQQMNIQALKHTLHITKEGMLCLQMKYQEEFYNLGKHLQGLGHAASGYQKVLEENRKLYNQVQDLRGNIRVYCRVRPFLPGQPNGSSTVDNIDEGNITMITPSKYGKEGRKFFSFNKVFAPLATQEAVFSDTLPLIRSVLDGYNVCIFAYGQTGSGKTYTMTGPKELTEDGLGVNYRALTDLFLLSNQRKDVISYEISVQMLEIYNEQVRDLLATDGLNRRLEIRNSSQNGINVPDACIIPVSSTSDVINLMDLGQKNRAVSSTAMNDRSSRSHSCLTVHVQGRDLTSGSIIRGSMHLVDLAGSERVDKSEVTGDRLKEAQHINKSLSALGDVISALAQKGSHVPYRNSKLTQLLQDSLGGQAKTLMFVHISPETEAIGETLSTLKFAERVATVELGAAKVNKDSIEVKELKEQIASLKAALARKEGETDHSQNSRSSTPERTKITSGGSSPCQHSWHSAGNFSNSQRQFCEGGKKSSITRRRSLDLHDLRRHSPPWTPIGTPAQNGKDDDKESISGDWVDQVMLNKHDGINKDENFSGLREFPETFYQKHSRGPSKIYLEQPYIRTPFNKRDNQVVEAQRSRSEMASTDDSDDLEAATSDSSDPDLLWQSNLPTMSSHPKIPGPNTKKSNPKPLKATEARSLIPSLIPSPARKQLNGVGPATNRPARPGVGVDGKRKSGHAK
ncbi:hypothetical protein K2173_027220 [Erythroxylum novogranatense]|uniref:Kinesin-like protein n=1 Tax=Erythroxylum novogranatense TaxID=1862640 RepID=A0AAV8U110_9ROSI|nr:hypothetical protein K2173_027220 [Erythroxylum novogranatense]